jgi:hypothetical protein
MNSITLHNIDPELNTKLRVYAAEHGCTIEKEVCAVLREKYSTTPAQTHEDTHPYYKIRALVAQYGGADDLEIP